MNEDDSEAVRELATSVPTIVSSGLAMVEVNCVFHRHMREGSLTREQSQACSVAFEGHVKAGFWKLVPVTAGLLQRAGRLLVDAPPGIFLRAGDGIHTTTARDLGEIEIWTNDRRMLAAAPYFGLAGRSV